MFGVYEVYTWDNVEYTKVAEFETKELAEHSKSKFEAKRKAEFKATSDMPTDQITYKVMDTIQYYNLIH